MRLLGHVNTKQRCDFSQCETLEFREEHKPNRRRIVHYCYELKVKIASKHTSIHKVIKGGGGGQLQVINKNHFQYLGVL